MINREKLKSFIKEIIIGVVIFFVLLNVMSYIRKPELSSEVLSFVNAKLIDDRIFEIKKDKPIVIHFWATWCPTCKMEASNIQTLSENYEVLTFAVKSGDNTNLQSYMDEHNFTFNVVNDKEGSVARDFNIKAFPTTFIYNAQKVLKFTEVGYTSTVGLWSRMKLLE